MSNYTSSSTLNLTVGQQTTLTLNSGTYTPSSATWSNSNINVGALSNERTTSATFTANAAGTTTVVNSWTQTVTINPPPPPTCPASYQLIETQEKGFIPASELKVGMHVPNAAGEWYEITHVDILPTTLWAFTVEDENSQQEEFHVHESHTSTGYNGNVLVAKEMLPGDKLASVNGGHLTVVETHKVGDGHYVDIHTDGVHGYRMGNVAKIIKPPPFGLSNPLEAKGTVTYTGTDTWTINVTNPPPPTVTLSADHTSLYTNPVSPDVANLTVTANGTNETTGITWSGSGASHVSGLTFGPAPAGSYTLAASYGGGTSSTITITVSAPTITLSATNTSLYTSGTGTPSSTALTVTSSPGGTVTSSATFSGSGAQYVSAGTFSGAPAGSYSLTATYASGTSNTLTISVTALSVSLSAASTTLYTSGSNPSTTALTVTANGANETSGITWGGTGASYVSGTTFGPAPAGSYTLTATWSGGLSNQITITVNTPTVILSAGTTTLYPSGTNPNTTALTVTANGVTETTATYTGTGASYVSNNTFGPAPVGSYTLTATYGGGTSNQITITVTTSAVILSADKTNIYPSGLIPDTSNLTVVSNGTNETTGITWGGTGASYVSGMVFGPAPAGTYTLNATFSSQTSSNVSINVAPPTVVLSASQTLIYTVGNPNTSALTVTASGATVTGATFSGTGASYVSNNVFGPAPAGTYTLTATYAGGSSSPINITVVNPTLNMTASATTMYITGGGTPTTSTITVFANGVDVTPNVLFTGSAAPYITQAQSGPSTFGPAPAGTFALNANYGGTNTGFMVLTVTTGVTSAPPPTFETLNGYAVGALYAPPARTPQCNILVASQINIFFGDQRHGYIPTATQVALSPGQYWIAQYYEILDANLHPVNSGSLFMMNFPYYSQAQDIAEQMYNVGSLQANGDGTFSRYYSVFLGYCDEITGEFQSPWDIAYIAVPVDNDMSPQPPCGHGMFLSSDNKVTLEDYAKKKLRRHKPVDISLHMARPSARWVGKATYGKGTLKIEDLALVKLNENSEIFEKAHSVKSVSLKIKKGQMLVATPTAASSWELQVLSVNDNLFDSSHTYVLGVVTDKFYSAWPMFEVATKVKVSVNDLPMMVRQVLKRMKDSK